MNEKIKNKKIKLLFFTSYLGGGGAEKVMVNLMNNLDRSKFDVSLVLSEKKGVHLNKVSKDVKINSLIKVNSLKNRMLPVLFFIYLKRFYNFIKVIRSEKPDVVVSPSNMPNLMSIFAKLFVRKIKVIICVHCYLSIALKEDNFLTRMMPKFFYSKADKIISVSKESAEDIDNNFGVPRNKIITIYNPHDLENIYELKDEEICDDFFKNNNPKIISVGSLIIRKGYKYLINAFKLVRKRGINADLIILGEGIEKANLENLSRNLGLENHVIFAGFKKNPYKYMRNSSVFVLSSLYEGLPNVIIEAMACGVPVVSTRCPSGPEEIITDGVNGLLVPVKDEKALANAIIDLLKDKDKAKNLAEEGRKRAEDFEVKKIVKEYEKVFVECYPQIHIKTPGG